MLAKLSLSRKKLQSNDHTPNPPSAVQPSCDQQAADESLIDAPEQVLTLPSDTTNRGASPKRLSEPPSLQNSQPQAGALGNLHTNTVKRIGLKRKPALLSSEQPAPKAHRTPPIRSSIDAAAAENPSRPEAVRVNSLEELRDANRRALLGNRLIVKRAPVCEGLTVPKLNAAYKAPWRGERPTNLGLVVPGRRIGKTLGTRLRINGGPLHSSRPAKLPSQQLLEASETADDESFEPLVLWEAPQDAPEGTPEKVCGHVSGVLRMVCAGGGSI